MMLFAAYVAAASPCAKADQSHVVQITFQSPSLSQALRQTVEIGAEILLPDSYYQRPDQRYPVVYVIPAFEGTDQIGDAEKLDWQRPMKSLGSEFIVVFMQAMMDIDGEDVHIEFADSASEGPWGTALTSEFVPATDAHFRTIASGKARFLFGHSSGAWSALWLQINYPATFNGAWALSPDPVDFHDFLGPDITRRGQDFFVDAAGRDYPMCRMGGRDVATLRKLVQGATDCIPYQHVVSTDQKPWQERQMDTYDDVFSPAKPNGLPVPLFDRTTGAIDPSVAAYWEDHYDMTTLLQRRWGVLAPQLRGKLHVFVGAEDTFELEGSVLRMRDALAKLGSDAEFGIAPGDDHWQIYDYHGGMIKYALAAMTQRLNK
jgi:S-formylglutathione hydrolase FrmB